MTETERPELDHPSPDVDQRIEGVVGTAGDLTSVADALESARQRILDRWLAVARRQPFHHDHPEAAVADHIPSLLDSVIAVLRDSTRRSGAQAPLDDPGVADAAAAHAQARFEQGLGPVAVVTEFRLLRQEVSRALIETLDPPPTTDVLAGQAVLDDALDGAATIGLSALSERIETLREEFLATTLHDVRQPITLLTGSLDLAARWLAEPQPDTERVAAVISDAVVAAAEVTTMLDTLGDASRVAMSALEPDLEPARLESIVDDALALVDRSSLTRIRVTYPSDGPCIGNWDPNLIRRVVGNLVGNALKYSPDGAPVDLRMQRDGSRAVTLAVQDRGMGLTPDEIALTFTRFGRGPRARASGIPGLGLGLYACRGIVGAHGGDLEVRSDGPGTGTTVVVRLPILGNED